MAEVVEIKKPNGQVVYALGGRVLWDGDHGEMTIAAGGFLPGRFRLPALGKALVFETDVGTQIEVGAQQFEAPRSSGRRRPDPWAPRSFGLT